MGISGVAGLRSAVPRKETGRVDSRTTGAWARPRGQLSLAGALAGAISAPLSTRAQDLRGAIRRARQAATAQAQAEGRRLQRARAAPEDALACEEDALNTFTAWLVANGVKGIGTSQDAVGIFEGEQGERGLAALRGIQAGEELLRIPLRLALTDHPEDEESNSLLYPGAPWSVRLAAKLLREKSRGAGSPWSAYLAILPKVVPSTLTAFEWEDMQEVQYQPTLNAIYETDWLAADAYQRCSPESIGSQTSEEEFRWAMSVVHSRTFGSSSQQQGAEVHMLVPLVDLVNHAGDRGGVATSGGSRAAVPEETPQDIAAWELVRSQGSAGEAGEGEWEMLLKALQPLEAGQEIVMSYGERDNEDFLVHYGFVPEANPHDSVELFAGGVREAAIWFLDRTSGGSRRANQEELLDAAEAAARRHAAEKQAREEAEGAGGRLQLLSGGRVDLRLLAAFRQLAQDGCRPLDSNPTELAETIAARMVAGRCWELLDGMKTTLEEDLAILANRANPDSCNADLFRFLEQQHSRVKSSFLGAGRCIPCSLGKEKSPALVPGAEVDLSAATVLAMQFRVYKKLLLWEVLGQLGPPLGCCCESNQTMHGS